MILLEKLKNSLRQSEFAQELTLYLNKIIPEKLFHDAEILELSIDDYLACIEDDKAQHTVVLSAQLSYQGIKAFLAFHANEIFRKKGLNHIRILTIKEYEEHANWALLRDKAFDVVFEIDGELCALEIKLTQSNSGFTGATHSTSKVNDYLLIYVDIDRQRKVTTGANFVKSMFIAVTKLDEAAWRGTALSNSSWTSFKFRMFDAEGNKIDYRNDLIFGNLKENRVFYTLQGEKI